MENDLKLEKGQVIQASNNNKDWYDTIYLTTIVRSKTPFITVSVGPKEIANYKNSKEFNLSMWTYVRLPKIHNAKFSVYGLEIQGKLDNNQLDRIKNILNEK